MEERHWPQRMLACGAAFTAGGLLTAWFKLLDVWGGRTLLTQGIALSVIIGGLLAGFLAALLLRRFRPGVWCVSALLALSVFWTILMIRYNPDVYRVWSLDSLGLKRTYGGYLRLLWASAVAFMLPVAFLNALGAALLARRYPASLIKTFALIGFCVGGIACRRLIGIPFELVLVGFCAVGLVTAFLVPAVQVRSRTLRVVCVIALILSLFCVPRKFDATPMLSKGIMGRVANRDFGFSGAQAILSHQESWKEVKTVFEDSGFGEVYTVDGRPVMTDLRFRTSRIAAAALPFFLKPNGARFALSGPEWWVYADSMKAFVTGVPGAQLFIENREVSGERGEEMWREVPGLKRQAYDALFIAPEPCWLRGAYAYTTAGFYQECSRFLAPDGILFVHLDVRGMNDELVVRRIMALKQTYPYVQIWVTGSNDWVLAASRAPFSASLDAMLKMTDSALAFKEMVRAGLRSVPEILAALLCNSEDVDRMISGLPIKISHKVPYTESRKAQKLLFAPEQGVRVSVAFEPLRATHLNWLDRTGMDPAVAEAVVKHAELLIGVRAWAVNAVELLQDKKTEEALKLAAKFRAENPRDMLMLEWSDRMEKDAANFFSLAEYQQALAVYESILAISEGSPAQNFGAALAAQALGQKEKARGYFRAAASRMPEIPEYVFALAEAEINCETYANAAQLYDYLMENAQEPKDRRMARFLKAKLLVRKENPHRDPEQAVLMAMALCEETDWRITTYAYGLADILIDAGRVMEGVSLKRKLREEEGAGGAKIPKSSFAPKTQNQE